MDPKRQCDLILERLRQANGKRVPMPELGDLSGSRAVSTRISNLRAEGHNIKCHMERKGRASHSSYQLIEPAKA
ncbi:MAG: hypothetical protein AAGI48_03945 [Verrucomicrobiota bacterium]